MWEWIETKIQETLDTASSKTGVPLAELSCELSVFLDFFNSWPDLPMKPVMLIDRFNASIVMVFN